LQNEPVIQLNNTKIYIEELATDFNNQIQVNPNTNENVAININELLRFNAENIVNHRYETRARTARIWLEREAQPNIPVVETVAVIGQNQLIELENNHEIILLQNLAVAEERTNDIGKITIKCSICDGWYEKV